MYSLEVGLLRSDALFAQSPFWSFSATVVGTAGRMTTSSAAPCQLGKQPLTLHRVAGLTESLQDGVSAPGQSWRSGRAAAANSALWFHPCSSHVVQPEKQHRSVNMTVILTTVNDSWSLLQSATFKCPTVTDSYEMWSTTDKLIFSFAWISWCFILY